MNNIFSVLINILNTVSVSGEESMAKMTRVFQILHQMEAASNKPDDGEGATQDG